METSGRCVKMDHSEIIAMDYSVSKINASLQKIKNQEDVLVKQKSPQNDRRPIRRCEPSTVFSGHHCQDSILRTALLGQYSQDSIVRTVFSGGQIWDLGWAKLS